MNLSISKYSNVIADKDLGEKIYTDISKLLKENEEIDIDFSNLIAMTTFCAKQIFGKIFIEIGQDSFFKRLIFKNVSEDLKFIIQESIQSAVEDKENLN